MSRRPESPRLGSRFDDTKFQSMLEEIEPQVNAQFGPITNEKTSMTTALNPSRISSPTKSLADKINAEHRACLSSATNGKGKTPPHPLTKNSYR
jgi:hypothetical protein